MAELFGEQVGGATARVDAPNYEQRGGPPRIQGLDLSGLSRTISAKLEDMAADKKDKSLGEFIANSRESAQSILNPAERTLYLRKVEAEGARRFGAKATAGLADRLGGLGLKQVANVDGSISVIRDDNTLVRTIPAPGTHGEIQSEQMGKDYVSIANIYKNALANAGVMLVPKVDADGIPEDGDTDVTPAGAAEMGQVISQAAGLTRVLDKFKQDTAFYRSHNMPDEQWKNVRERANTDVVMAINGIYSGIGNSEMLRDRIQSGKVSPADIAQFTRSFRADTMAEFGPQLSAIGMSTEQINDVINVNTLALETQFEIYRTSNDKELKELEARKSYIDAVRTWTVREKLSDAQRLVIESAPAIKAMVDLGLLAQQVTGQSAKEPVGAHATSFMAGLLEFTGDPQGAARLRVNHIEKAALNINNPTDLNEFVSIFNTLDVKSGKNPYYTQHIVSALPSLIGRMSKVVESAGKTLESEPKDSEAYRSAYSAIKAAISFRDKVLSGLEKGVNSEYYARATDYLSGIATEQGKKHLPPVDTAKGNVKDAKKEAEGWSFGAGLNFLGRLFKSSDTPETK